LKRMAKKDRDGTRTRNLWIRSPMLYPLSHTVVYIISRRSTLMMYYFI
jgi:hypothetical protein